MSELPAGSELDRLVAERVMGWAVRQCTCGPEHIAIDGRAGGVHFQPSSNIAHAWGVVEKMAQRAHEFTLHRNCDDSWLATISEYINGVDTRIVAQQAGWSAPEAICRAALKAVEGT